MNWKIKDQFAVTFDFMCKCRSHDVKDFIFMMKNNHLEMLCKHCERKYIVKMGFEEK